MDGTDWKDLLAGRRIRVGFRNGVTVEGACEEHPGGWRAIPLAYGMALAVCQNTDIMYGCIESVRSTRKTDSEILDGIREPDRFEYALRRTSTDNPVLPEHMLVAYDNGTIITGQPARHRNVAGIIMPEYTTVIHSSGSLEETRFIPVIGECSMFEIVDGIGDARVGDLAKTTLSPEYHRIVRKTPTLMVVEHASAPLHDDRAETIPTTPGLYRDVSGNILMLDDDAHWHLLNHDGHWNVTPVAPADRMPLAAVGDGVSA